MLKLVAVIATVKIELAKRIGMNLSLILTLTENINGCKYSFTH